MYILAVLKRGSEEQKARFMFTMLEQGGSVDIRVLRMFGNQLGIKTAFEECSLLQGECASADGTFSEDRFVVLFKQYYANLKLFNWTKDVVKEEKGTEDAVENEKFCIKQRQDAQKKRIMFPEATESLIKNYSLDNDTVEKLKLSYDELKSRSKLTAKSIRQLLAKYGIQGFLVDMLLKEMVQANEITFHNFLEVMTPLTRNNLAIKRNELLFRLLSRESKHVKM